MTSSGVNNFKSREEVSVLHTTATLSSTTKVLHQKVHLRGHHQNRSVLTQSCTSHRHTTALVGRTCIGARSWPKDEHSAVRPVRNCSAVTLPLPCMSCI